MQNSTKNNDRIPIFKKCLAAENGGCFCTGMCKEVIGYTSSDGSETVYLKCSHGILLTGFGCSECNKEKQKNIFTIIK